jgi:hypothetical protein
VIGIKKKKENKVKITISIFKKEGLYYTQYPNGQIQIDKINYWATTEKWYDNVTGKSGVGINSFLRQLKNR